MVLNYLKADAPLVVDTPGGIYAYTALGRVGITEEEMPEAYDSNGYVMPLLVVKARSPVPTSGVGDELEKRIAQLQFIECWMYQWIGYDKIEIIDNHLYRLLQFHRFPGFTTCTWNYSTGPTQDMGSLNGASLIMKDYMIRSVKTPV